MKKQNNKEAMRERLLKVCMCITAFTCFYMCGGFYAQAGNLGESVAKWGLDQIFWVGVLIIGVALIGCLMKKAWVQAIIIFVIGAVVLFIIKNPELITKLGQGIGNQIFTD